MYKKRRGFMAFWMWSRLCDLLPPKKKAIGAQMSSSQRDCEGGIKTMLFSSIYDPFCRWKIRANGNGGGSFMSSFFEVFFSGKLMLHWLPWKNAVCTSFNLFSQSKFPAKSYVEKERALPGIIFTGKITLKGREIPFARKHWRIFCVNTLTQVECHELNVLALT